MSPDELATICVWCAALHFSGGWFIWTRGYRFSGACFVLNGVVLLSFATSLVRNGAPGG